LIEDSSPTHALNNDHHFSLMNHKYKSTRPRDDDITEEDIEFYD